MENLGLSHTTTGRPPENEKLGEIAPHILYSLSAAATALGLHRRTLWASLKGWPRANEIAGVAHKAPVYYGWQVIAARIGLRPSTPFDRLVKRVTEYMKENR